MCPHPSIKFFLISLLVFLIFFTERVDWRVKLAPLAAGTVISVINTFVEYVANKYGFYSFSGPLKILSTPLPLFVAWIFLASSFALATEWIENKKLRVLFVVSAIPAGWGIDLILWKWWRILHPGPYASPFINASVWVVLIPLSVILKDAFKKFLFHN